MSKFSIYFAAPLHDKEDQDRNTAAAKLLRDAGFDVYLPQEHGVWEDIVAKQKVEHPGSSKEEIVDRVRSHLYETDSIAVRICDITLIYHSREKAPSEGQLWEGGLADGLGKPIILVNETSHTFNLMPEYGADYVCRNIQEAIKYIKEWWI